MAKIVYFVSLLDINSLAPVTELQQLNNFVFLRVYLTPRIKLIYLILLRKNK